MDVNRFSRNEENRSALFDKSYRQVFWPPASEYKLAIMKLSDYAPSMIDDKVNEELIKLESLIREDWKLCTAGSNPTSYDLINKEKISNSFRRIAELSTDEHVKKALEIRAKAIESGYSDDDLKELTKINETVSFIAGKIGTFSSKHSTGLPSAFASVKDPEAIDLIEDAHAYIDSCRQYMFCLHKHLLISDLPVFAPGNIFFIAGEANTHPKHVAYFLPEDEGIMNSPFQKTYYFVNTHRKILESASLPLAEKFLDLNGNIKKNLADFDKIQTLGVFAHEIGHFVHIKDKDFTKITEKNKWISHVMQETAADVFGILMVAEIFAEHYNIPQEDVIYYYLAECLRYMDRGLGVFSDSDGMYLQLNYFLELGALTYDSNTGKLTGDSDYIIAGLRSLARVLTDTLLNENIERIESLYNRFGPSDNSLLSELLKSMAKEPLKSIEYI